MATTPKHEPGKVNVGDVVLVGAPPVAAVVIATHKRQGTARRHAAKSDHWRYTRLPGVGWVVIQPVHRRCGPVIPPDGPLLIPPPPPPPPPNYTGGSGSKQSKADVARWEKAMR